MRRICILILFIVFTLCSFGQRGKGIVQYLDVDTLKGEDTIYISLPKLTGYYSLAFELFFDEVGGTSDGTGILESSNDTNYVTLNNVEPVITGTPNDTITISDGLIQYYFLYGTPSINYRVKLIGTPGDTTRIISNYVIK